MALTENSIEHLTLDDLLEAINPPSPSPDERFRRALQVTVEGWQNGQLTDIQADEIIQALFTVKLNSEVGELVSDYFTPEHRRRASDTAHRRFSLI